MNETLTALSNPPTDYKYSVQSRNKKTNNDKPMCFRNWFSRGFFSIFFGRVKKHFQSLVGLLICKPQRPAWGKRFQPCPSDRMESIEQQNEKQEWLKSHPFLPPQTTETIRLQQRSVCGVNSTHYSTHVLPSSPRGEGGRWIILRGTMASASQSGWYYFNML